MRSILPSGNIGLGKEVPEDKWNLRTVPTWRLSCNLVSFTALLPSTTTGLPYPLIYLVIGNLPQKICLEIGGRGSKREPCRKVTITGIYSGPAAYNVSFPAYVDWMQLCVWSYKCPRASRILWAGHEIQNQAHSTRFKFQTWPFLLLLCCRAVYRFCYVLLSCLETEFSAANGIWRGPVTHDFESRFYIYNNIGKIFTSDGKKGIWRFPWWSRG